MYIATLVPSSRQQFLAALKFTGAAALELLEGVLPELEGVYKGEVSRTIYM